MIYAFTLVDDQGQTQFGLVTADEPHKDLLFLAHDYLLEAFPDHTVLEIDPDIEPLVDSQYSGIALLTTV